MDKRRIEIIMIKYTESYIDVKVRFVNDKRRMIGSQIEMVVFLKIDGGYSVSEYLYRDLRASIADCPSTTEAKQITDKIREMACNAPMGKKYVEVIEL